MDSSIETSKSATAFQEYCALGPDRSLAKLGQMLGKKPNYVTLLERWSSKYHWQARVQQYDAEQLEKERKRREQREQRRAAYREKMEDERVEIFHAEWQMLMAEMNRRVKNGDIRGIVGFQSMIKTAADIEYQAAGGTSQTIAISGPDQKPIQIEHHYVEDPIADELAFALLRRLANPFRDAESGSAGISGQS